MVLAPIMLHTAGGTMLLDRHPMRFGMVLVVHSRKQPQPIVDLVGTASLVKSGMDALYACAITGTGNVECWKTS